MFDAVSIRGACDTLGWTKMTDLKSIRLVPFGIYSITEPLEYKPKENFWPHELKSTVYIGMAGKSYDILDSFHDRKSAGSGKEFWMCSKLYKRMNAHRKNLIRSNLDKKYESSYNIFFENYGNGEELMDKIYFNVLIPKTKVSDHMVRSWLLMMESLVVYSYSVNFGRQPIMQLAHMTGIGDNMTDDSSFCQQRRANLKETSLENFYEA